MHILVVDDERDIQPLFEQKFRKEIRARKIAFSFASSGTEALHYLHQHPSETPLVLSDINMPGMSGLELLKQIKTDYATTTTSVPRVMMITAYGDEENYQQAKQLDFGLLREKLQIQYSS